MKNTQTIDEAEESTRRRVAAQILQHGPVTAMEIATELELTPAAVRRHLTALEAEEAVETRPARVVDRGRGRPAKAYVLTAAGRAQFPQGYDQLACDALEFLAEHGGEEAIEAFARARVRRVEERFRALAAADPTLEPAAALSAALNAEGYVAQVRPAAAGAQLCQHYCPVAHVAERFPQLCAAETRAFEELVGTDVRRLATIAHGDFVCTTHIPIRQGES